VTSRLNLAAAVLGIAGLGLLGFETAEAMRSVAITTVGTTLIFVGLGLFVIAAVIVVVGLTTEPQAAFPAPPAPATVNEPTGDQADS
jgi:hypothetical protein